MDKPRCAQIATRRIIADAVSRHWHLVSKLPGADADDLVDHFIAKLLESEEAKFESWWQRTGRNGRGANEEGAWSNFLNMLVYRRLLDMKKVGERGQKRVVDHLHQWEWGFEATDGTQTAEYSGRTTRIVYDEPTKYDEPVAEEFEGIVISDTSAGDESLFEWTRNFYLRAKRVQKLTPGEKYTPAQAAVCGFLMLRLSYEPAQMRQLLIDRKDLRRAMDFNGPDTPGVLWLEGAMKTVLTAAGNV